MYVKMHTKNNWMRLADIMICAEARRDTAASNFLSVAYATMRFN